MDDKIVTAEELEAREARKWLHVSIKISDDDLVTYLANLRGTIQRTRGPNKKMYQHIHDATAIALSLRKAKYG